MIIDSLADKTGINISELTIPSVEVGDYLTFDPKVDIKEEYREKALIFLNGNRFLAQDKLNGDGLQRMYFLRFFELARALNYFYPNQVMELFFGKETVDAYKRVLNWDLGTVSLRTAALAKFLLPEYKLEIPDEKKIAVRENVISEFATARRLGVWYPFMSDAVAAKQLFTEGLKVGPLTENEWLDLATELNSHRFNNEGNHLDEFIRMAADVKLLFPERVAELNIDKATWQRLRQRLNYFVTLGSYWDFFKIAYPMAILAAEVARITSKGEIELLMPKPKQDLQEKIPEMPVKRIF